MNTLAEKTAGHEKNTRTAKKIRRSRTMQNFSRGQSLAVELAVAVIAPVLLGQWLDSRTGKEPWFTIGGFVLGGAAAFRSALRAASELRRGQEEGGESSTPESST